MSTPLSPEIKLNQNNEPFYEVEAVSKGFTYFHEYITLGSEELKIKLQPEKIFRFKISDEVGSVTNPEIELYDGNTGDRIPWKISKTEEGYEVRGLPNRTRGYGLVGSEEYLLRIKQGEFPDNVFKFRSQTNNDPLEFRLQSNGSIEGSFTDNSGNQIQGINYTLSFKNAGSITTNNKPTGPDGKFIFENLGSGRYLIHYHKGKINGDKEIGITRDDPNKKISLEINK